MSSALKNMADVDRGYQNKSGSLDVDAAIHVKRSILDSLMKSPTPWTLGVKRIWLYCISVAVQGNQSQWSILENLDRYRSLDCTHHSDGLQRQSYRLSAKGTPIITIEGSLERALKHLLPANKYKITLSSRTDKGVHSLRNSCHVDLQHPENNKEYHPQVITNLLNYHLKQERHHIRVLETLRVSDEFHARFSAIERRYIYRLAHSTEQRTSEEDEETVIEELMKYSHGSAKHPRLPFGENVVIPDAYHLRAYRHPLDINKLISAAEMLSGIHNYMSFTRRIGQQDYLPHPVKLMTIGIKRGQALGQHMYGDTSYLERNLEFWDIHVRARSFLYRQIRRMVGAMVLVARDIVTLEELKDVLDNPRSQFSFSNLLGMEEFGLFLTDVLYKPEDLKEPKQSQFPHTSVPDMTVKTDSNPIAELNLNKSDCEAIIRSTDETSTHEHCLHSRSDTNCGKNSDSTEISQNSSINSDDISVSDNSVTDRS